MKYKVSTYAKIHGVTMRTVWNWINKGELEIERTSTGRIRIVVDENKEKKVTLQNVALLTTNRSKSMIPTQVEELKEGCLDQKMEHS